ncbi:MAG TPA: succinate--CoA ligase subunit alpha [Candidatus Dormibacteraeota bacterium]|nr:succinate--CoA ligase subunit alpha [Candidatus Dormibacteraeota bacterium]
MSVLIGRATRVLVQGITGRDGAFHTRGMLDYGTKVVAGVTPGKAGEKVHSVPVFDSVEEAVLETGANCSVIYVPAALAQDAIYEAVDSGIPLVVCISEGIPVRDMVEVASYMRGRHARLIGPNCPGLISPGQSKVGIMPGSIVKPGKVGVVSRSGTLTYEVVWQLTRAGLGQSTCIGIGGDPIVGTRFADMLALYQQDPGTEAIVLIGEIGGSDEEDAALLIKRSITKPVVAFVAGQTAPPGKRMGHAGAIVSGGSGTAQEKMQRFLEFGIPVARTPSEIPALIQAALRPKRKSGLKLLSKPSKRRIAKPSRRAKKPSRPRGR